DSPRFYWRLGEAETGTLADEMGNFNGVTSGALTMGATGLLPGDSDTAIQITGNGQYFGINDDSFTPQAGAFSVEYVATTTENGPSSTAQIYGGPSSGGGHTDYDWMVG